MSLSLRFGRHCFGAPDARTMSGHFASSLLRKLANMAGPAGSAVSAASAGLGLLLVAPVPGLSSRAKAAAAASAGARARPGDSGGGPARDDLVSLIGELTEQMHTAAAELQFEVAARIRDEIRELKQELRGMQAAGV